MTIDCIDCGAVEVSANNLYWHYREAHNFTPAECYEAIAECIRAHSGPWTDDVPENWEPQVLCESCQNVTVRVRRQAVDGC